MPSDERPDGGVAEAGAGVGHGDRERAVVDEQRTETLPLGPAARQPFSTRLRRLRSHSVTLPRERSGPRAEAVEVEHQLARRRRSACARRRWWRWRAGSIGGLERCPVELLLAQAGHHADLALDDAEHGLHRRAEAATPVGGDGGADDGHRLQEVVGELAALQDQHRPSSCSFITRPPLLLDSPSTVAPRRRAAAQGVRVPTIHRLDTGAHEPFGPCPR